MSSQEYYIWLEKQKQKMVSIAQEEPFWTEEQKKKCNRWVKGTKPDPETHYTQISLTSERGVFYLTKKNDRWTYMENSFSDEEAAKIMFVFLMEDGKRRGQM
jgi:hypothetical protein